MVTENSKLEADRQLLLDAANKGRGATFAAYFKLSGPGWLQSAITLGGGSLAGSLYVGVIGGYQLLWLQPVMMILGVVMLSAIGYVALSTQESPFHAINRHVNPVLGWGWAIATLMANLVWAMPQFSLGTAALQQNLFPELLGGDTGKYICIALLFIVAGVVIWFYDSGGWGIRLFEIVLKVMVGVIVLSFFGVVVAMTLGEQGLPWKDIGRGFLPNWQLLFNPADTFQFIIADSSAPEYWRDQILSSQRDRMVTAAATAVGINMTFLLPYSMLKRGWTREFRGLATFDLCTGLFIPFVLATSCVVIAAASQFHGQYDKGLVGESEPTAVTAKLTGAYERNLSGVVKHLAGADADEARLAEITDNTLKPEDRRLAAMLVQRDAFLLADSLKNLTGPTIAQTVFGIGVLGMAISTIIILMLINGFTICEMLRKPSQGWFYRFCCFLPGISGALGFVYLWGNPDIPRAKFWLAVPTSVFGMVLLPIAYVTFFLLMNNRRILGDDLPRPRHRFAANLAMLIALAAATVGASWAIWGRSGNIPETDIPVRWAGVALAAAFVGLAILVHFVRPRNSQESRTE